MATADTAPTEDGLYGSISDETYHRDKGSLSSSGARLLMPPSCPALFRERIDNPPKPKREYTFGHVAHRLLLGEGADIVEIEAPSFTTKAAQQARDAALAEDKAPILTAELAKAQRMADEVRRHPHAGPLFERGHAEVSLYYTDPETGVRLRARPDWLTLINDRMYIVDFKTSTTAHPEEFARKAAGFGYFCQAAWYRALVIALGIHENPRFLFVVSEKDAPHIVTVAEYDDEAIAEGQRRNREAIRLYVECRDRDEWPTYIDEIAPISLPVWALDTEIVI